jgi:Tfp pilus assembly protein FimT
MNSRPKRPRATSGLTLLEVILVLSLLVIIAGFSWPLLTRAFQGQDLRSAADLVRSRLTRTRIEAIDKGAMYEFRYTVDGRRFRISQGSCAIDAPLDSETGAGPGSQPVQSGRSDDWQSGQLPEGITFFGASVATDAPAGDEGAVADEENPLTTTEQGWSEPIQFEPDGSANSASITIRNTNGRCIEIVLNGLTGVVTVSETFSEEETLR